MSKLKAILLSLFICAAAPGLTGCDKIMDIAADKAKEKAEEELDKAIDGDSSTGDGNANYFDDASEIPQLFKDRIGGATRVLEMTIRKGRAEAQIQNPKKLLHVDAYKLNGGKVGRGRPVKFIGKKPTKKSLKFATFNVDEIDFKVLPKLITDAPARLKYENAKLSHVILKRPLPFNQDVRWRVYVSGDRSSGSVEYDAKGTMTKVYE